MASNATVYAIKSELEQVEQRFHNQGYFSFGRCRQQVYVNKINECCQDIDVSVKYALLNYANMGICPHTESTNCPDFKLPSAYVHPQDTSCKITKEAKNDSTTNSQPRRRPLPSHPRVLLRRN
jgi:hypothetical protein